MAVASQILLRSATGAMALSPRRVPSNLQGSRGPLKLPGGSEDKQQTNASDDPMKVFTQAFGVRSEPSKTNAGSGLPMKVAATCPLKAG